MPLHSVGIEQGRNTLPELASRAHAGESSLLTKHGKPYAAIVPPEAVLKRGRRPGFLALRGSGRGLWGRRPAAHVAALRDEWS
jgi:antitoxin (DNA-binding transcriptional repressor) of toxin-antitoxin stability system